MATRFFVLENVRVWWRKGGCAEAGGDCSSVLTGRWTRWLWVHVLELLIAFFHFWRRNLRNLFNWPGIGICVNKIVLCQIIYLNVNGWLKSELGLSYFLEPLYVMVLETEKLLKPLRKSYLIQQSNIDCNFIILSEFLPTVPKIFKYVYFVRTKSSV